MLLYIYTVIMIESWLDFWELWRNLGDDGVRKAAYRGG
ncbi:hypothetical protein ACVIU7_005215 [Bradyrhizobium liaoningense]